MAKSCASVIWRMYWGCVSVSNAERQDVPVAYDYLILATGASHSYFGHNEFCGLRTGFETRYAERERDRFLRSGVHTLRPRTRRALELRAFQGNSLEESALQLGISVSATKARMFHAKVALCESEVLRNIKEAI